MERKKVLVLTYRGNLVRKLQRNPFQSHANFFCTHCTKIKFSIKDLFSKCDADLVTFTEEILNGKLYFSCSDTGL